MDTHFDVLILGTGLTQSITAAALAKAGFKVLHVDQNAHYGADQASLSHDELLEWSRSPPAGVTAITASTTAPLPSARAYALSLTPALIPSSGPLIAALILSGVSRYGQFKLLDSVSLFRDGALRRVPGNKEDVFKTRDVSLVDKRKLMRFLQFAGSEFEGRPELEGRETAPFGAFMRDRFALGDEAVEAILYALAYCSTPSDPTLPALVRLRQYIRSAGRYGNSPFLVGHYGGLGELAQGFCRTCAVKGGTYILGRKILSLQFPTGTARASIALHDVPDVLTADLVIASPDYLPAPPVQHPHPRVRACCIAITTRPLATSSPADDTTPADTAVVVFPPGALPEGTAPCAVRALQMGDATLSCPRGKYVLYLSTHTAEGEPEALLRPYLAALTDSVEFALFYTWRESDDAFVHAQEHPRTLFVPPLRADWPEIADTAAQEAERLFWDAVKELTADDGEVEAFWPPLEPADEDEAESEEW